MSDEQVTCSSGAELSSTELEIAAAACGILHNVFYFKPTRDYLDEMRQQAFLEQWPDYGEGRTQALSEIAASLQTDVFELIEKDYYSLFIGPGGMKAYPWGSVYTDKDNIVCGDTARQFKQFCNARGIQFSTAHSEPEDHIGLVIGVLSRLFEQASRSGERADVAELLGHHLLPWSHRVIDQVLDSAATGFYSGFARLLQDLLTYWQKQLDISPRELPLFA